MSKIEDNVGIFIGNWENQIGYIGRNSNAEHVKGNQDKQQKASGANIFAGDLKDTIYGTIKQKKELARKEAAKVISDKFAADNKASDKIKELDAHQEELKAQAQEANGQLHYFDEEKEKLKEIYGITEEYISGTNAEYEERLEILNDEADYWKDTRNAALENIVAEGQTIESLKQSMLGQTYTMKDAMKQAQEILDEASKDIVGLLQKEAIRHVEDELEEEVEQAEKVIAEKEEQQEKLEHVKEAKKELEERVEELHDVLKGQEQIRDKIDVIQKEAELLDEDMKGLLVDVNIL